MSTEERFIGSLNTLDCRQTHELVTGLIKQVRLLGQDTEDYLKYHNVYSIYTTLLLFYSTGHRPVIDPFCYSLDIDTENGHVLIDDKTVTEQHRYRLTVLPDIACEQVKQYRKHLRWLMYRLKNAGHLNLCSAIDKVLDNSVNQSEQILPFLFLVKKDEGIIKTISISESTLEQELTGIWPLKMNQSRHNISTYLRDIIYSNINKKELLKAHDIEAHLGHMEQLNHPFGKTSIQSFEKHKDNVSPFLNEMMINTGWSVISAKKHAGTSVNKTNDWMHSNLPLGPINRVITRRNKRSSDLEAVKTILNKYEKEDLYQQDTLNNIRDKIIDKSPNSAETINRRLSLLLKFLTKRSKLNKRIKFPDNYIAIQPEASPYTVNTINGYISAKLLRKKYLNYLAYKGRSSYKNKKPYLSRTTRIAEIVISAALLDSISDANTLKHIARSDLLVINESDQCFIEITDEDSNFHSRWIPSKISLALVHGFHNDKFIEKKSDNIEYNIILDRILLLMSELYDTDLSKTCPIEFLAKNAESYSSISMPGFLKEVTNNQTASKHLSQSTLVRIFRKEKLVNDLTEASEYFTSDFIPLASSPKNKNFKSSDVGRFIKDLESDLKSSKETVASKNQDVERLKRQKLISLLNNRFKHSHHYPPIAAYMASWIKKLCQHGTDLYTPMLKFSVIDEYARMVAKSVCYLLYNVNSLDIDIDEYEYIYEVALESNRHADKTKFKNNLSDFHNFLVTSGVADPIDWEPINKFVSDTKVTSNVDANFITVPEYESALNIIYSAANKNSKNAKFLYQCCTILILGYRFGLRVSEAIHLEFDSIQSDEHYSYLAIHVTNNRFKTTKSIAGRRTIPLIGQLNDIEKEVIHLVLTRSFNETDETNIFINEDKDNRLIDYSSVNRIIKNALVLVTGDQDIRFHHLRHSFANRIFSLLFNNDNYFTRDFVYHLNDYLYVPSQDINILLTGQCELSNRSLIALSTLMGHSDISTTFANYIHITDILLNSWQSSSKDLEKHNDRKNTDFIVHYCTGAKHNYISRERQKNKISTSDIQNVLSLFTNKKRYTSSCIITGSLPETSNCLSEITETKKIPDLLDIDSAITLSSTGFGFDSNKIASRLYLDSNTIDELINHYQLLLNQSLYDGYYLERSQKSYTNFTKETQRVRSYIKSKPKTLNSNQDYNALNIQNGLKIWEELHHPHEQATGLIISNSEDFFTYIKLLESLGVDLKHLKVYIPIKLTQSKWYKVTGIFEPLLVINDHQNNQLMIHNFSTSKAIRHTFTKQRFGQDHRLQIVLDTKSLHPLKYQKSLDRLCFLLHLQKTLHNCI